MSLLRSFD